MSDIYNYFSAGFKAAAEGEHFSGRRIGSELKFPLVNAGGSAAAFHKIQAL